MARDSSAIREIASPAAEREPGIFFRFSISSFVSLECSNDFGSFFSPSFTSLRFIMRYDENGARREGIDPRPSPPPRSPTNICPGHLFSHARYCRATRARANIHVPNDKYILMPTMSTKTESDKVGDNIERARARGARDSAIKRFRASLENPATLFTDCDFETLEIFHTQRIYFSLVDASIIKESSWVSDSR